ncbi:hypothetical protein DV738_g5224, partial [Chaetothyriales sp. CBS 135597]
MAATTTTTTTTSLPPAHSLTTLTTDDRSAVLDLLFEPSPALHTLASSAFLTETSYPTYSALISAVRAYLTNLLNSDVDSHQAQLNDILSSHPRLGEKKGGANGAAPAAPAALSQGSLAERLSALNDQYEARFAGLKYVTFVNGRPRPVIMEDMEKRIQRGDLGQEKLDAVEAMCDIALDRAKKLGAE